MKIFQYSSLVLFNIADHEVEYYLQDAGRPRQGIVAVPLLEVTRIDDLAKPLSPLDRPMSDATPAAAYRMQQGA